MKRSRHPKQHEQTWSPTSAAEPAAVGRNGQRRGRGTERRPGSARRKSKGGSRLTPARFGWLISAAVVLVVGVMGWHLHTRPSAPIATGVPGVPLAPEEKALQRATEQHLHDPEPWRKLGTRY